MGLIRTQIRVNRDIDARTPVAEHRGIPPILQLRRSLEVFNNPLLERVFEDYSEAALIIPVPNLHSERLLTWELAPPAGFDRPVELHHKLTALMLASLERASIVKLFRFGIDDWEEPFLVMEHVRGESLAHELARIGKLTPEKFLLTFTEVLNGLAHAHQNKIAHRDLKPSNLMICSESGSTKIIDFGIAKGLGIEADGATLTKDGAIIGTPAYMSPEQCKGERGAKLSDIYSLACIMFESLTGTPPFQGDSAFEVMYKHMSVAPPKLLSWAKSEKEKTLAGLIDRCLEKDPAKRPQSAEEMQAVLKEISAADFSSFSAPARTQSTIFLVISTIIILNLVLLAVLFKLPAKKSVEEVRITASKQDGIKHEISRLSALCKNSEQFFWSLKDGERKERTGHQLLNLFQDLGNRQLASTDAADLEAVYDTADREMKVCARMQNKFNGRNASCHALRARAALQQGKLDLADREFVICERIIVDVWGEDAKAWQDLLLERSILRLRQKRYEELVSDLGKVFSTWDGQNLETWILFEQVLDRAGPDRPQMVLASFNEFEKLSPSTEKETEQFLKISNLFAHQLRQIQKYERYSGKAAIRSKKLLLRLPHADESLRLETEQVLEECADFIDVK